MDVIQITYWVDAGEPMPFVARGRFADITVTGFGNTFAEADDDLRKKIAASLEIRDGKTPPPRTLPLNEFLDEMPSNVKDTPCQA